jgi:heptosyltransferase-2
MKRVLLIRLSSLGDIVLLTPVLDILSKGMEVHLLTGKEYTGLFKGDHRLKRIYGFERGISGLFRILREIRRTKYDLSVDLHLKPLTLLLLLLSRAKEKRFYRKRIMDRRLSVLFKRKIKEVPIPYLYLKPFLKYLREVKNLPPPVIKPTEVKGISLPEKFAVLAPGAKYESKRWLGFKELSKLIKRGCNIQVVIVGDSGDVEIAKDIEREVDIINFAGKTNLERLVYVLSKALFVVSNDSGPAHLGTALKKPVYVIFGPTVPEFGFRPMGSLVRVFEVDLPCRPCSLHGEKKCKRGDLACLGGISPSSVYRFIKEDFECGNLPVDLKDG